jgi:hypothetical protein
MEIQRHTQDGDFMSILSFLYGGKWPKTKDFTSVCVTVKQTK